MSLHYDLHSHSTASDGTLSPTELVTRAHDRGVHVLALTDHDSTEDINVEIVKVRDLAKMILEKKVENAGTLVAYLLCCTGMKISGKRGRK